MERTTVNILRCISRIGPFLQEVIRVHIRLPAIKKSRAIQNVSLLCWRFTAAIITERSCNFRDLRQQRQIVVIVFYGHMSWWVTHAQMCWKKSQHIQQLLNVDGCRFGAIGPLQVALAAALCPSCHLSCRKKENKAHCYSIQLAQRVRKNVKINFEISINIPRFIRLLHSGPHQIWMTCTSIDSFRALITWPKKKCWVTGA